MYNPGVHQMQMVMQAQQQQNGQQIQQPPQMNQNPIMMPQQNVNHGYSSTGHQ